MTRVDSENGFSRPRGRWSAPCRQPCGRPRRSVPLPISIPPPHISPHACHPQPHQRLVVSRAAALPVRYAAVTQS
jgi:hypothetical protein